MITSPLAQQQGKVLEEKDIPRMKHDFRRVYGWISDKDWDDIDIKELLTAWSFVNEEVGKMENLRLQSLSFYGVKNPK